MKRSAVCAPSNICRLRRKKTADAIRQDATREVDQLLHVMFSGQRSSGQVDLRAVEMAVRSAMHQAGAAALGHCCASPSRLPISAASLAAAASRLATANCGPDRSSPLWAGPKSHARTIFVRTAKPDSFPPTPNWTSNIRSSRPVRGVCTRWSARQLPSIRAANKCSCFAWLPSAREQHAQTLNIMRAAWKLNDADEGMKRLEGLARFLESEDEPVARSLSEGVAEMFTVQRLKLPPSLYKCLGTTNVIELETRPDGATPTWSSARLHPHGCLPRSTSERSSDAITCGRQSFAQVLRRSCGANFPASTKPRAFASTMVHTARSSTPSPQTARGCPGLS